MAQVLHPSYEHNELALDAEDEVILDRVWAKFRAEHPNYRSPPEEIARVKTLAARRKALYDSIPSREERDRIRADARARLSEG